MAPNTMKSDAAPVRTRRARDKLRAVSSRALQVRALCYKSRVHANSYGWLCLQIHTNQHMMADPAIRKALLLARIAVVEKQHKQAQEHLSGNVPPPSSSAAAAFAKQLSSNRPGVR
jgi:hypothetical protein